MVIVDREYADAKGLEVLAVVRSWASAGIEPARTGLAPTVAVPRALERGGVGLADVDLVEINEAFASMSVACARKLGFPHDIVNVNGGAVGMGHPVGCSGPASWSPSSTSCAGAGAASGWGRCAPVGAWARQRCSRCTPPPDRVGRPARTGAPPLIRHRVTRGD